MHSQPETSPAPTTTLGSLPPELLSEILSHLSTRQLLTSVATVCRGLYSCVEFLTRCRLKGVDCLEGYHLIFECFPPGWKSSTRYHHCWYKGSYPLSLPSSSSSSSKPPSAEKNKSLRNIYSHFTPLPAGVLHSRVLANISSPTFNYHEPTLPSKPQPPTLPGTKQQQQQQPNYPLASVSLPLDSSEPFTQLSASSLLIKPGPRMGLFSSVHDVFAEKFFRVRRSWLRSAAREPEVGRLLWINEKEDVGLRLRVRELRGGGDREAAAAAAGSRMGGGEEDEEGDTVFVVEYEELVVRSGRLLEVLESVGERKEEGARRVMVVGIA